MEDNTITIQEAMKAIKDGAIIHIGSSSGFFFIGNKEEYEALIDLLSEKALDDFKLSLKNKKTYLEYLQWQFENLIRKIDDCEPSELHELKQKLELINIKMIEHTRYETSFKECIKRFKPFRERKVLDIYPRIQCDGIVVIVEGDEKQRYWWYEEFKQENFS